MHELLYPSSVAIIGASNHIGKVGNSLMQNLKNFKGKVFPINLKEKTILNKKAYSSVLDVKEKIDLAVIAIPSVYVKQAINDCAKKNVKYAIVISAGFSEIGKKQEELDLVKTVNKKLRILGANCFGIVNPYLSLDLTFAREAPNKGSIAFISQSGALWSAISSYSLKENFGFSGFISLGNSIDLSFEDFIQYFNKDKNTKVIVLYIESLKNGKKFIETVKSSKKPIIVIKSGRTDLAKKAALSHTGALAGNYEIYKAAFKQSNAILSNTLTEAFDKAKVLSYYGRLGKKVLIITNAGGPGTLMTDFCEENSLEIVNLQDIKFNLPEAWSHNNPIDLIGDATVERFNEVFSKIKSKNFYDIVIVIITPQKMTNSFEIANACINFKKQSKKPIIACFMEPNEHLKNLLEENKIPCFFELERAVKSLNT